MLIELKHALDIVYSYFVLNRQIIETFGEAPRIFGFSPMIRKWLNIKTGLLACK